MLARVRACACLPKEKMSGALSISSCLVADVPHDAVLRGGEDVVQGDRQLGHAQGGAKVA